MSLVRAINRLLDRLESPSLYMRHARGRWMFEPHVNTEYGVTRVYSRFRGFFGELIGISLVRLPLDLVLLALAFWIGCRLGGR